MKKYMQLTEAEKLLFVEEFYRLSPVDDTEAPYPFGAPWLYYPNDVLLSKDIKEAARLYFLELEQEINAEMAIQKQNEREGEE